MKHIKGDALEWAAKEGYCMIHVCNNKSVMGSGVAKQVKARFPRAFEAYWYNYRLGCVSRDPANNIINLVAQNGYGRVKRHLNYGALSECLHDFMVLYSNEYQDEDIHTVVVPYKMGSDRAGGDWEIVLEMVSFILEPVFEILVVEWEDAR